MATSIDGLRAGARLEPQREQDGIVGNAGLCGPCERERGALLLELDRDRPALACREFVGGAVGGPSGGWFRRQRDENCQRGAQRTQQKPAAPKAKVPVLRRGFMGARAVVVVEA